MKNWKKKSKLLLYLMPVRKENKKFKLKKLKCTVKFYAWSEWNSFRSYWIPRSYGIAAFAGLRAKHQQELENLTLTTQPFKTLKFFIFAVIQYLRRTVLYLLSHGGYLMVLCTVGVLVDILLFTIDGPHEKVFCSFLACCPFVCRNREPLFHFVH